MFLENNKLENFKIFLSNYGAKLFDHDYRILFENFKILEKRIYEKNLIDKTDELSGGSIINKLKNFTDSIEYKENGQFDSPFKIISNKNIIKSKSEFDIYKKKTDLLIDNLKLNNFDKAEYVCKKDFIPLLV